MPPAKKTSTAKKTSAAKTTSATKKVTAAKKSPAKTSPAKKAPAAKKSSPAKSSPAKTSAPAGATAKVAAAVAPQPAPATAAGGSPRRTPSDIARDIFAAVNRRDADAVVAHNADDCFDDFVAVGQFRGKKAIRQFFAELFAAAPDFTITPDLVVGDDSHAVVQWHASGRFTGLAFQGIEATGRRVEIKGVDVMEFRDGLLARNTIYYDGASFARQMGLLPPQGSRADRAMLAAFNAKTKVLRRGRR